MSVAWMAHGWQPKGWLMLVLAVGCGPGQAAPVRAPRAAARAADARMPARSPRAVSSAETRREPSARASETRRAAQPSATSNDANAPASSNEPDVIVDPVAGPIDRRVLMAVLDRGLGRFLQGVRTEPYVVDDRFVGFRILSLYPDDPRFADVPLQPGDVLLRVNGRRVERPGQALKVWKSLRVAGSLVLRYRRDGEVHEARYIIE